jgi:hypothetical protein
MAEKREKNVYKELKMAEAKTISYKASLSYDQFWTRIE